MRLVLPFFLAVVQAIPPNVLPTFGQHLTMLTELNLTAPGVFDALADIFSDLLAEMRFDEEDLYNGTKMVSSEDSKKCYATLAELLAAVSCRWSSREDFARPCDEKLSRRLVNMLDSWPKLPAGLLRRGPFFFLGDYDQCMELVKEITPSEVHYCTADMEVKVLEKRLPLTTGLCLPAGCSPVAIRSLLDYVTEKIPKEGSDRLVVKEVHCQRNDAQWWRRFCLGLTLLLLAGLLLAGTYVDNCRRTVLQKSKKGATTSEEILHGEEPLDYEEDPEREEEDDGETDSSYGQVDGPSVFNAPSIALTYRSAPDLKRTLISRTTLVDILCAFSIRISLNHLFRNSVREVSVLHGIKVFSAFWVILGHCCLFSVMFMDTVLVFASSGAVSPWLSSLLFNSSLAVDSFLLITGIVLAFSIRKRILFRERRDSAHHPVFRLLVFYVHRAARLWPALLLFSVFMSFFYLSLGDGPLWTNDEGIFGAQCTWPDLGRHLTFVSNFFPSQCLPWLWYVSLDFQLYLFSPIFLFLLSKTSRTMYLGAAAVVLASLIYRIVMYVVYSLPTNIFLSMLRDHRVEESETAFSLLYASPISRCPPFVVGLAAGWAMCLPPKNPPGWIRATAMKLTAYALLVYSLFAPFSDQGAAAVVHAVLHRALWSLGLALIVWLAENNHHPVARFILASPKLLPISRLSFGIYLTHEPIVLWLIWSQRQPSSASHFGHFVLLAVTVSALSLVAAFFFAICFELPMLSIERLLLKKTDCSFNRTKDKQPLAAVQRRLGPRAAVLNFEEKTALWLEDYDAPYRKMVRRMEKKRSRLPAERKKSRGSSAGGRLAESVGLLARELRGV